MSNISATAGWDNVTLLDSGTPATGGPTGTMNSQAQALVNRLEYLKQSLTVMTKEELRHVDKTKFNLVRVLFNAIPFDFGGGDYYLDASDTGSTDNNGTVVVGVDGGRWKLAQYDVLNPLQFGAVPDPATDSLTQLNNCLTEAAAIATGAGMKVIVDLMGQTYYVSSANVLAINQDVQVRNGTISTIGNVFTATDPLVKMVSNNRTDLVNVVIDANWKCAGLLRSNSQRGVVDYCNIRRFQTYGLKDTGKNTESMVSRTRINQYEWGDANYDKATSRTAYGLWADSADCMYAQFVAHYARYPLYVTGVLNQFDCFHVYNGNYSDSTPGVGIRVDAPAKNNVFTNGYYDNGSVQIFDSFVQTFVGGVFQRNKDATNPYAFDLLTATGSEDVAGLVVTGLSFNGSYTKHLKYSTTGAGTWVNDKKIQWSNNVKSDGTSVGPVAQWLNFGAVTAAGNIVMGSTSERSVLGSYGRMQLVGNTSGYSGATLLKYGADINPAAIYLGKTRSATIGAFSPIQAADVIGRIAAGGDAGADYDQLSATIDFRAPANWSGTSTPTEIRLATTATGSTTRLVRWLLDESALSPFTNNSYDLGTSTTRVKTAYTINLDVSGNATIPGPFADDPTAATGGISVGGIYRGTDGFVHWRQA